jgi:hypothetical protein
MTSRIQEFTMTEAWYWNIAGATDVQLWKSWRELLRHSLGHCCTLAWGDLIHRCTPAGKDCWLVYSQLRLHRSTLPNNYDHVSVVFEVAMTTDTWRSYLAAVKSFFGWGDHKLTFVLTEYGKQYNHRVKGVLHAFCTELQAIALSNGAPMHANEKDSEYEDFHITYNKVPRR